MVWGVTEKAWARVSMVTNPWVWTIFLIFSWRLRTGATFPFFWCASFFRQTVADFLHLDRASIRMNLFV
jgi:hypothetical protein